LPEATDNCSVEDKHGDEVMYGCGHTAPERYTFNLYGDKIIWGEENYARRDICGECWMQKLRPGVIRCARCGLGISPGFQVALYRDHKSFHKPWKTVIGRWPHKHVIGCARRDCEPGGFVVGIWMGDRIEFYFGGSTIVAETVRTKKEIFNGH